MSMEGKMKWNFEKNSQNFLENIFKSKQKDFFMLRDNIKKE